MRPWSRRRADALRDHEGFDGEWLDIGEGECQGCLDVRRMYRPVSRLDVHLCAECVKPGSLVMLSNDDRAEDDEVAA